MAKIIISNEYGAGFCYTNESVYVWMEIAYPGQTKVVKLADDHWHAYRFNCPRDDEQLAECLQALGTQETGYEVVEYDAENFYPEIDSYDGVESVEFIPIINVDRIANCSAEEIEFYLEGLGYMCRRN